MHPSHATETVATLRFGERCSMIQTNATANMSMLESVLYVIDTQITQLEGQIRVKERWELREIVRTDVLVEKGTLEAGQGKYSVYLYIFTSVF